MITGEWDCAVCSVCVFFLEWPSEPLWPTMEVQSNYTRLEQNREWSKSKQSCSSDSGSFKSAV